jgi:molybdate transport system regulatory protein
MWLAFSLFPLVYYEMRKPRLHPQKEWVATPGIGGRIWIDGSEGTFLGYGRIVLLERIREYGSITKAAKSMEMSYRHAWELVDSMNRQASKPFVESATGGRSGGGAKLTKEGEKAIILFWELYADFQKYIKRQQRKTRLLFNSHKKENSKGKKPG